MSNLQKCEHLVDFEKMLNIGNEYLVAKIGFDTTQKESLKDCSCIHAPPTLGHEFRSFTLSRGTRLQSLLR